MRDLELFARPQQSRHDRVLRVCVHTAASLPHLERIPEQRRAGRLLEGLRWPAEEDAVAGWVREGKDEYMLRFDALLLDTRGCD
jgi:hypothetical protein